MIGQLAVKYPGSGFDLIPKGLFNFGGGGVNGSGAICGNFNGGAAVLKILGAPSNVMNNFQRWFENTYLPTNAAYVDYASGTWTPGGSTGGVWGGTGMPIPLNNAPRVKPLTLTCHGAHTRWKMAANAWIASKGSGANSDRCSKTSYDAAYKLATLINDWKAGVPISGALDPSVGATGCKTPGCHAPTASDPISGYPRTGASGQMKCEPCHTQRMGDGHNL